MKIVFLCGSLEPGKDGVGDYTKRLAEEVKSLGNEVAIVAINDDFIKEEIFDNPETVPGEIKMYRIPNAFSPQKRFDKAKLWIDAFNPEWISLQYVAFAYNSKGLTFNLSKYLLPLGNGRKWHIMFHELWIATVKGAPKKHYLLGFLQKRIIKSLINKLKPSIIHTHTKFYQNQLTNFRLRPAYLPLFSNIPVSAKEEETIEGDAKFFFSFVVFGSIYPNALIEEFSEDLSNFTKRTNKKVLVSMIGRGGEEHLKWKRILELKGITIKLYGEQSEENISRILRNSSGGITTTPLPLAEKSGTVAAMLEHHLPVLCLSKRWLPYGKKVDSALPSSIIVQYSKGELESFFYLKSPITHRNNVKIVAEQFTNDLSTVYKTRELVK